MALDRPLKLNFLDTHTTQIDAHKAVKNIIDFSSNKLVETVSDVLSLAHQILQPELYLEIGVHDGSMLAHAQCAAIGVDSLAKQRTNLDAKTKIIHATSDLFFMFMAEKMLQGQPDLVFIDGMPLVENTIGDFIQCERHAKPTTLIAIANPFPRTPEQGMRHRNAINWAGDVWKLRKFLQEHRPELFITALEVAENGLLLVAGLDPNNRVLSERYATFCEEQRKKDVCALPPLDILERQGSIPPNEIHSKLTRLFESLSSLNTQPKATPEQVSRALYNSMD